MHEVMLITLTNLKKNQDPEKNQNPAEKSGLSGGIETQQSNQDPAEQ